MQQPEHAMPYPVGSPLVSSAGAGGAHPVWRYGLLFGALSGLFAIVQLSVSVSGAVENRAAFASLYYGVQNQALDPTIILRWLGPVLTATYTSCFLGFALSMWLCWHAGRAVAAVSGRRSLGALAGMVTSMVGSAIWIVASVVAVALVHIDGSISGVLTASPTGSSRSTAGEIAGLVVQEAIAALIALGAAALAGRLGAAAARMPTPVAPPPGTFPWPGSPGLAYFTPGYGTGYTSPATLGAPNLTPPPSRPFVVAPMYPPPPEFYQAAQQGAPYGYPPAPPMPGVPGFAPPAPFPSYPPRPWSPPTPPSAAGEPEQMPPAASNSSQPPAGS